MAASNQLLALPLILLVSVQAAAWCAPEQIATYADGALDKPIAIGKDATVTVTLGSVEPCDIKRPVWIYKTKGLKAYGQPELVVTVLKPKTAADDSYPPSVLKYLRSAAYSVKIGNRWTRFMWSEYPSLLGSQFTGIAYLPANFGKDKSSKDDSLAVIPLTEQELRMCRLSGSSRAFGRIACQSLYFPCPYWYDPDRKSSISDEDVKEVEHDPSTVGVLNLVSHATAIFTADSSRLKLSQNTAEKIVVALEKAVQQHTVLRVQLQIDPDAMAFSVWEPEKVWKIHGTDVGFNPQGAGVSGQFLLLMPNQKQDSFSLYNDGYVLMLTEATFGKMTNALAEHKKLTIPLNDSVSKQFELNWQQGDGF